MKRTGLLLLLVLAACSGGATDIDRDRSVTVDGLPIDVYDCVLARWNDAVDTWNELVRQRDEAGAAEVVVDGVEYPDFDTWARAHGQPLSYEEVRDDPAVVEACGG